MLDFIPEQRLQGLHAATSQILPEAKAIYTSIDSSNTAATYLFESELKKRIRSTGLDDADVELTFNAIMEELNPTKPRLTPSDFPAVRNFPIVEDF